MRGELSVLPTALWYLEEFDLKRQNSGDGQDRGEVVTFLFTAAKVPPPAVDSDYAAVGVENRSATGTASDLDAGLEVWVGKKRILRLDNVTQEGALKVIRDDSWYTARTSEVKNVILRISVCR